MSFEAVSWEFLENFWIEELSWHLLDIVWSKQHGLQFTILLWTAKMLHDIWSNIRTTILWIQIIMASGVVQRGSSGSHDCAWFQIRLSNNRSFAISVHTKLLVCQWVLSCHFYDWHERSCTQRICRYGAIHQNAGRRFWRQLRPREITESYDSSEFNVSSDPTSPINQLLLARV